MTETTTTPPAPAPVTIELARVRNLYCDLGALCDAEGLTGRGYLILADLKTRDVIALLWAGLRHEDPSLTPDAVGHMIGPRDIPRVLRAIREALNLNGED